MSRARPFAVVAVLVGLSLSIVATGSATASHFRASGSWLTVAADAATWTIDSAWHVDDADAVFSTTPGALLEVQVVSDYADDPGSGLGAGVFMQLGSFDADQSNKLFDRSTEVIQGDLSTLPDGIYDVYASNCCRVGGVENTPTDDFSAWARFTKSGGGYDLPPAPNALTLYALLKTSGDTLIDFRSTDPEGGPVGYQMITDSDSPYYGADPLPCSTFVGGLLTVGPTHCTGPDVYTDIYLKGTFWALKVVASDAAGNQVALDSLLHVLNAPSPYIDYADPVGNGTALDFWVYDDEGEPMDTITVTCTSTTDPTDVVSGTAAANPVRVIGLTPGSEYECDAEAANEAGSGSTSYSYSTGAVVLDGVAIVTDLAVGDKLAGTEMTLYGANLQPSSPYTLVQHSAPVTLFSGTASVGGDFSSPVTLGSSACVAGVHTLTLSGVDSTSATVTDRVWYELDADCRVVQFSRLGAVTASVTLAATGAEVPPYAVALGVGMVIGGVALAVGMRRRLVRAVR
ncbi:MAG: hypothetical protein ACTHMQ_00800 [Protaetiibacter sp.]